MPRPGPDPLAAADLVLVDGSNLLHALRRGPAALPPAALIGRIRAVIPPSADVELVFDGPPEPGMRRTRVAAGVSVHYAAPGYGPCGDRRPGREAGFDKARERLLVVSDDGGLRAAIERLGARTARSRWLIGRLDWEVLAAPAPGNRRAPASPGALHSASDRDRDDSAPRWQPGRGATAKRGNPRRGHPPGR